MICHFVPDMAWPLLISVADLNEGNISVDMDIVASLSAQV
jgi:hypothetical protein